MARTILQYTAIIFALPLLVTGAILALVIGFIVIGKDLIDDVMTQLFN